MVEFEGTLNVYFAHKPLGTGKAIVCYVFNDGHAQSYTFITEEVRDKIMGVLKERYAKGKIVFSEKRPEGMISFSGKMESIDDAVQSSLRKEITG